MHTPRELTISQLEAIGLLALGDKTYGEIADSLGIHRNTLTQWMKKSNFQEELEKYIKIRASVVESRISADAEYWYDYIKTLSKKAESEGVKADIGLKMLDRIFGKATTKIEYNNTTENTEQLEKEKLMKMFQEIQEKNNVMIGYKIEEDKVIDVNE